MEEKEINNQNEIKEPDYVMAPIAEENNNDPRNDEEYNKPAFWSMRIVAGIIDVCLIFLAVIGLRQLIYMTPLGAEYNKNYDQMREVLDDYKLRELVEGSTETYGYKVYEGEEKYAEAVKGTYLVHVEADTNKNYVVLENENISPELIKAFDEAVKKNDTYNSSVFNCRLIDFGIIAIAGFIAELAFVLIIPLCNKRRATIGKLVSGTQVINSKYFVEAKWYQMVGRFFFIYIIESALPTLMISSIIISPLAVGVILFIVTLTNKNRKTIHDFVARTMVIDKKSFKKLADQ